MKEAKATQRSVDIPVHESKTKRGMENQRCCLEGDSGEDRGMTGWETKTLGEVAQIERGKFSHRPRNEPRFYGGNTPFVQTGDVTRSNGIVRTYTQTLNKDGVAISKVFPEGTILITIAANIGYAGILEFESAAPDSLIGLTPDDTVSAEFLNFYLRTQQPEMDRMAPKGTQKNINIQFLKPWPVVVPPLPEQKKIAHILSTVQRAIEAQERIIQTTTELKKALMHKLFTEGLRNEPQKQTEIGPVPESWEVAKVGDFAKIQSGGTPTRDIPENWIGGTIPWVKTGEIDYCVIKDTEEKITPVGLSNSAARLYPAGTLLMAMYGQGITRGRVGLLGIEAATNQACASISPMDEEQISSVFLFYYFQYHYENLRKLGHGANQRNMNAALIRSFPISFPEADEQATLVAALESLDAKSQLNELMTAKTRVHEFTF